MCDLSIGKVVLVLAAGVCLSNSAQTLQPISLADPALPPPASAGGDSWGPTVSRDGRFVLFSSTADNLLLATNGQPIPPRFPAVLNAFLRDRAAAATRLVSVNLSGVAGGDGDSLPIDISTNGRYALFESSAGDLVPGDTNGVGDVFVRDLLAGVTLLVSANTNGLPANGASASSAITPDGRYVAFVSMASDLVPGDTNGIPDVFVRDLQTGTTVLASPGAASSSATLPTGGSAAPEITPDGRYVVFHSTATNLVPGVSVAGDVYVRDLVGGTTTWASAGARAAAQAALGISNVVSFNQAISADGRFVAYEASPLNSATGLILRYDLGAGQTGVIHTNGAVDGTIYQDIQSLCLTPDGRYVSFLANTNDSSGPATCVEVWDAQSGVATLVSGDLTGAVPALSVCEWPSITPDGRYVLFLSSAPGLVTNDTPGDLSLYLHDLQSGVTTLVNADTNGIGSLTSPDSMPSLSADGQVVAFDCNDSSLVPDDRNHASDVFVRDIQSGTTELVSGHDPALPSLTANAGSSISGSSLSLDGRLVAFESDADNLTAGLTGGFRNVYARDLLAGSNVLVSVNPAGLAGDGSSTDPAISGDGRFIAFESSADDLVPGDTNHAQDVFVRDLQTGTTTLVSVSAAGTSPGRAASFSPSISGDGRFVLFHSGAGDLVSAPLLGENVFLRDRQAAKTYALSQSGGLLAAMTPDGRSILFGTATTSSFVYALYVWDSQAASVVYTNLLVRSLAALTSLAISADGTTISFGLSVGPSGTLYTANLTTQSNTLLDSGAFVYTGLHLSRDGRSLACARAPSSPGPAQVYLFDTVTGRPTLVSRSAASGGPANDASDSPDLTPDGRFLAYRSAATDLVPGNLAGNPQIFLYDAWTGTNTLFSVSPSGDAGDNRSLLPVFSGDGRTLCFSSWASDLTGQDFNQNSDVFAFNFLFADIVPSPSSGQGPLLSWPYAPGQNYRVQFRNTLADPRWQDLSGTITNYGNRAWLRDSTPAAQRFYRIVIY